MTQQGILVAGIGNIFLGDDAFGVEGPNGWPSALCQKAYVWWTLASEGSISPMR
jgi:hypothetical protein